MSIYKSNKNNKDKKKIDHHIKKQNKRKYSKDEILDLMGVYRDTYRRENRRVKRR